MHIIPWSSTVTIRLGLVRFPTCRVAKPTPADGEVAGAEKRTNYKIKKMIEHQRQYSIARNEKLKATA